MWMLLALPPWRFRFRFFCVDEESSFLGTFGNLAEGWVKPRPFSVARDSTHCHVWTAHGSSHSSWALTEPLRKAPLPSRRESSEHGAECENGDFNGASGGLALREGLWQRGSLRKGWFWGTIPGLQTCPSHFAEV